MKPVLDSQVDYSFYFFPDPVQILTEKGWEKSQARACIIFPPGIEVQFEPLQPESSPPHTLIMEAEAVLHTSLVAPLPKHRLFYPKITDFIPGAISEIRDEIREHPPCWHLVSSLLFSRLIILLYRGLKKVEEEKLLSYKEAGLKVRMENLRVQMYENLIDPWPVEKMAREVHLSPSRFHAVYKEMFGVRPNEDLIRMRIQLACRILRRGDHSIRMVALNCGYQSVHYFTNLFRRRMGCTPGAYKAARKMSGEGDRFTAYSPQSSATQ